MSNASDSQRDASGQGRIHVSGPRSTIAYAQLNDGTRPSRDFYNGLDEGDKDKFDKLFMTICEMGTIRNPEKFHPSVGKIKCNQGGKVSAYSVAEFKVHTGAGKRILAILDKSEFILTHGFLKGVKLASELKKAQRIFCEDLSRRLRLTATKGSQ